MVNEDVGIRGAARLGGLYVVSAPSGAGKTSLLKCLVSRHAEIVLSVSYTTREPRIGERDGIDYHFVDEKAFQSMRASGECLESASVFGHWYGTSAGMVSKLRTSGKHVILEIDWQGARAVRERQPDAHTIFILPPSYEVLLARLRGRGTDSSSTIAKRMAAARNEMRHWHEYEYVVINDEFEKACSALEQIIAGQGSSWRRDRPGLVAITERLLACPSANA